ncbi:sugar phosphate isomerase/epimerase family protein [Pseudonocardia hispaniensis]|uniref:Sugar phosphate isomerase/epimerase family protein n=1 Tax=Pseudonocardia hispaniensis TaxID=904933 RepID=A0ABW1J7K0_9PSEU
MTFRSRPVPDVAALAADAGLEIVEWGADAHVPPGDIEAARAARRATQARGLGMGSYGSYHKPGHSDPAEFAAIVATAAELGAPRIRVWAGTSGSAHTGEPERARITSALRGCVEQAAAAGLDVIVEHHVESLTDDLGSALRLHAQVGHPGLARHWQPRELPVTATCLAEVRTLRPTSVHAFSWGADGFTERFPLAERADLWEAVLVELSGDGADHEVLLEFVPGDSADSLRRDAASLRGWRDAARSAVGVR